jgi:signal transduction histidine kinase
MANRASASKDLYALLARHRRSIASAWTKSLAVMPQVCLLNLGENELRALVVESVDQFREDLASPAGWDLSQVYSLSLIDRINADPAMLAEALWLIHKAILPHILGAALEKQVGLMQQLDSHLGRLTIQLTQKATYELQEENRLVSQQATTVADIVRLVGSTLDLGEVLTRAGNSIAAAAGANYCFFYLVDSEKEGDLWAFTPANIPFSGEFDISNDGMGRISHDYLSPSDAVWQVIKEKQPISIFDAQEAANTTHVDDLRKTGIKSFLLVPCLSKGVVVAVAVIMTFTDTRYFSSEEIENSLSIATIIAPAIENARLYQHVEQLSAIEERARLARMIHDNLAQTLGAMQMKTSQTGELLLKEQIEAARNNVNEIGEIARQAYTDIREVIFNLRTKTPSGEDFIRHLRDYLATYQTCFGIKTTLNVLGDPGAGITEKSSDQIMYIIQEALTNIRKHARADAVQIQLKEMDKMVQVQIADDGTGFDLPTVQSKHDWRHLGLQIMKERAAAIGSNLDIDSLPGQGTQVRITVPLRDGMAWKPKADKE